MLSTMKKTIAFLGTFIILSLLVFSCKKANNDVANDYVKTESGLEYKILKEGKGKKARKGDEVLLYETTSYRNGTVLYSNENSENPIKIKIGANQVTKAIEEGLLGMKGGEIKEIIAPNYLVKREIYPDNVSPDSTLVIKLIVAEVIAQ